MRDKLTELLEDAPGHANNEVYSFAEIADHLIAKGVAIPVRCKDCHWWRKINRLNGSGLCRHTVFSIDDCTVDPQTDPDDFCSYGERRSE